VARAADSRGVGAEKRLAGGVDRPDLAPSIILGPREVVLRSVEDEDVGGPLGDGLLLPRGVADTVDGVLDRVVLREDGRSREKKCREEGVHRSSGAPLF
jgi:hypothetical protein